MGAERMVRPVGGLAQEQGEAVLQLQVSVEVLGEEWRPRVS
jgi:hypothetical protein